MNNPASIAIRDSRLEASAACLVCGNAIPAGEGVTARYGERTLRFKCPDCLNRFEAAPERYLADHEAGCCKDDSRSPASEWMCDR
jgi:hypothetical protein